MVGREDREAAPLDEPVEEAHGDGAALLRVGAGAELVEEYETLGAGLVRDAADDAHMPGEGGEGLVDGLLVAYVGVDRVEDREARLEGRGYGQSELVHAHRGGAV